MTSSAPVTGKISAVKTGLILLFLLAIWLVLAVLPSRNEAPREIPPPKNVVAEKLREVGLPDNPDLGGLPEIFAIWADHAEWKDGRTKFAYWHPVMKTYAYFFEATRVDGQVKFKEISEPHDPTYRWDESLPDDCPVRFYTSPYRPIIKTEPHFVIPTPDHTSPARVKVDVSTPGILAPSATTSINVRTQP